MKVASGGRDQSQFLSHGRNAVAVVAGQIRMVGFHAVKALSPPALQREVEVLPGLSERLRMREHRDPSGCMNDVARLAHTQPLLGNIERTVIPDHCIKGFLEARHMTVKHQPAGKVWSAHGSVAGELNKLLIDDLDSALVEESDHLPIALLPEMLCQLQLRSRGSVPVPEAKPQKMEDTTGEVYLELDARNEPYLEPSGFKRSFSKAGNGIMISQGNRRQTLGRGQGYKLSWGERTVGSGRMGMQVNHARKIYEGVGLHARQNILDILKGSVYSFSQELTLPRPMNFKAHSVIYFRGDVSDKIYILKSGRISLNSTDIETGQEIHDQIRTGEFFGVKSAMGKYPREENAVVLSDTSVIMFSVPEFEQLVSHNTRIIMKMLKVFSNQLRRMHTKVSSLLADEEHEDPESGLFTAGQYYLAKKRYPQALYAFRRYLTYYPSGRYHAKANEFSQKAEQFAQQYGAGKGPSIQGLESASPASSPKPESGRQLSDAAKEFYAAVSTFSQQKYAEALKEFKKIAEASADEEYRIKSLFEIGRCFFNLKQYDACIKHFTSLIQRYPKLPELPDALYYVGQSYAEKGDQSKAMSFYENITNRSGVGEALLRKVRRAMKAGA